MTRFLSAALFALVLAMGGNHPVDAATPHSQAGSYAAEAGAGGR